jgi:hypothetical protein
MTDENPNTEFQSWGIVADLVFTVPYVAAVRVRKLTAVSVMYLNRYGEEMRRQRKALLIDGITEDEARLAAERMNSSRALYEEDAKKALARHNARSTGEIAALIKAKAARISNA